MKLALIQIAARREKEDSLALAEDHIRRAAAAGADLVLLPEMFNCPYKTDNFPLYAEEEGGASWQRMSEAARETGIYLAAGSMPERDAEGNIFNTAYVFDRNGAQIAKHRKMHLFDIDVEDGQYFRESDTLTAGGAVTVFDTEFGRFGLMICYDIRFPELARLMELEGAVMILVPGCFNMTTGPAHWELTFRARALDNQVFMAGCSQAREDGDYIAYGHSLVTDPWGKEIAALDEKEGMLITDIDFSYVNKVRAALPFIRQRRTDIYHLARLK